MKRKRTVIGISVAAVLAVCTVVLAVVFGVRSAKPHVHEYDFSALSWEWAGSGSARASASCACGEKLAFQAEISQTTLVPATCEETGKALFTAKINSDGVEYTDAREFDLPALGHEYDYSAVIWSWEEDGTATAYCARDPFHHLKVLSAEIAVTDEVKATCTKAGYKKYTATVQDDEGKQYTDEKWAEIPKGEHVFEAAEFWNNDSHELICKECGHSELAAHENGEDGICTLCGMSTWLYYTVINADGSAISVSPFAFDDSAYKKVVIPSRCFNGGVMAEVEYLVFKNSPTIESVVISEGIDEISDHAFYGCSSLKEVTCPDVVRISDHAFAECKSLTEFVCPKGVTALASAAFQNCTALTKVTLPNGLQQIYDEVFSGCSALSEIELPQTVTLIDNMAFYQCSSLTQINLPKENIAMSVPTGLHTIGEQAFAGCYALREVVIPKSVTHIGANAFEGARRVVIYCEAASKPQGWEDGWNNDRPVYWAYEEDLVNG